MILFPEFKAPLELKLKEISDSIMDIKPLYAPNLMGGALGNALFLYQYFKYFEDEKYLDKSFEIIDSVMQKLDHHNYESKYSFGSGMAGLGWMLYHIKNDAIIDIGENGFFAELNIALFNKMKYYLMVDNFDFLYGAAGICWFFIKTNQKGDNNWAIQYFLEVLYTKVKKCDNYHYWLFRKNEETQLDKINLGLAHGIPAIIIILSEIAKIEELKQEAINLLRPTINLIVSAIQDCKTSGSYFGYSAEIINNKLITDKERSRLAWCYGDLSVAWSLVVGARTVNDPQIQRLAEEIIIFSAARNKPEDTWVFDHIICHGSSGNALLFKKINEYIKRKEITKAEKHWLNLCLSTKEFLTYNTQYNKYEENYSLLEGTSGIGLVLLSFLSEKGLPWDECLLLS